MKSSHRLRTGIAAIFFGATSPCFSIDTADLVTSTFSADCLEYRVVGMCFWLRCSLYSCSVETSVKVRHYIPDAVVSSYNNTGGKPVA